MEGIERYVNKVDLTVILMPMGPWSMSSTKIFASSTAWMVKVASFDACVLIESVPPVGQQTWHIIWWQQLTVNSDYCTHKNDLLTSQSFCSAQRQTWMSRPQTCWQCEGVAGSVGSNMWPQDEPHHPHHLLHHHSAESYWCSACGSSEWWSGGWSLEAAGKTLPYPLSLLLWGVQGPHLLPQSLLARSHLSEPPGLRNKRPGHAHRSKQQWRHNWDYSCLRG